MSGDDEERWERAHHLTSLARGYQASQVLISANRLGVFAAVGEAEATAGEIARRIGADPRATGLLLDALAGLGLLVKRGPSPSPPPEAAGGPADTYRCSPDALEFLLPGKPWSSCDILRHDGRLYERWGELTEAVTSGRPARVTHRRRSSPEQRDFILGMANVGERSARLLRERLSLGARRRLLDVGGGPGTYAAVFCEGYPDMQATVFDLPETLSVAREYLSRRGLGDRIALSEGNFLQDPLPPHHDVALLSNIVHSMDERENRRLISKVWEALDTGGLIVIKDFRLEEDRAYPSTGSLFALNMLLGTDGGRAYTTVELADWLVQAGFKEVATEEFTRVSVLVTGVRGR
jgi:predicted O-methyltransferase YrrM